MALVKWKDKDLYNSLEDFRFLQDEINELFDVDRVPSSTGLFDRSIYPAVDVLENDHEFMVYCELPGINQKEIDVSITSNVLTIKGEKKEAAEEQKDNYFRKETWSGNFQRTISLPNSVDTEKVNAGMKNGVLTIKAPIKEESKPKQISVKIK